VVPEHPHPAGPAQRGLDSNSIGWDTSVSAIWRPNASQNLVFRLSGAVLHAGSGFRDLFAQEGGGSRYYSVLANATLAF
jgi:hypothetical protein